ncbi:MAG: DUF4380 domain-containing protein [Planctomycetes bacterium]|nr:DUF4380 domain-containing protein [Planctomycetota bacterium]
MKMSLKKTVLLLALMLLVQSCSSVSGGKSKALKKTEDYKGWDSICMSNGIIQLNVVPAIGGRVVQYALGDKEFFWVNPDLEGELPTETGLTEDSGWVNYGGDKLWPAPQGWDNDQQWPGPPDAVLDGQAYELEQLTNGEDGSVALRLTSGKDMRSGISFSRVIRLYPNSTRVSIDATMTNVDNKSRRWGIWGHTQLDGASADGKSHNSQMNAYCPINPDSHFEKGYDVIFGEEDNPSFQPDYENNMMKVNYQYRVGKIGMDSDGGWVATVDGQTGNVFVHRFVYEPEKEYPDGSSVEFWHNGIGSIFAYNETMVMSDNPKENAYVFESEVLSPFAKLEPGESYSFNYEWFSTQIGGDFPVVDCTPTGVVCQPLQASKTAKGIQLQGRLGVFYKGDLVVKYLNASGEIIDAETVLEKVSPLTGVVLSHEVKAIDGATLVAFHLYDKNGRDIGRLAELSL